MAKVFTVFETVSTVSSVIICLFIIYGPHDNAFCNTVRSTVEPIGTWVVNVLSKVIRYEVQTYVHWVSINSLEVISHSEPEACENVRTWKDLALICPEHRPMIEKSSASIRHLFDCFPQHLWGVFDSVFPHKKIVKLGYTFHVMYDEPTGRYKTQSTCLDQENTQQVATMMYCEVVESSKEDHWLDYKCDTHNETFVWRRYVACDLDK